MERKPRAVGKKLRFSANLSGVVWIGFGESGSTWIPIIIRGNNSSTDERYHWNQTCLVNFRDNLFQLGLTCILIRISVFSTSRNIREIWVIMRILRGKKTLRP